MRGLMGFVERGAHRLGATWFKRGGKHRFEIGRDSGCGLFLIVISVLLLAVEYMVKPVVYKIFDSGEGCVFVPMSFVLLFVGLILLKVPALSLFGGILCRILEALDGKLGSGSGRNSGKEAPIDSEKGVSSGTMRKRSVWLRCVNGHHSFEEDCEMGDGRFQDSERGCEGAYYGPLEGAKQFVNMVTKICRAERRARLEADSTYILQLEATARELRKACRIRSKKRYTFNDMVRIATSLGISVYLKPPKQFPDRTRGLLTFMEGRWVAVIKDKEPGDSRDSEQVQKFALAHEIGHFVRTHKLRDEVPIKSFKNYREHISNEFEAHHIAGALLVDSKMLLADLNADDGFDPEELAKDYDVDYETVTYRIAILPQTDFHFIELYEDGTIDKRYAKENGHAFHWLDAEHPCCNTVAFKVLSKENIDSLKRGEPVPSQAQHSLITYVDALGNKVTREYFCLSKLVLKKVKDGKEKAYSITIGCDYSKAGQFKLWRDRIAALDTIKVSPHHCFCGDKRNFHDRCPLYGDEDCFCKDT